MVEPGAQPEVVPGGDRPAALRRSAGAFSLGPRRVLALLAAGPQTLADLVLGSGLPRRTVEGLLAELVDDLVREGDTTTLRADRAPDYRTAFALDLGLEPGYGGIASDSEAARTVEMAALIERRPEPDRHLDHVGATAETAARRASWLAEHYDLDQTRLLFAGDHDLTALAVAALQTRAQLSVVDLDDRILEFIDVEATTRGWLVSCLWGDFTVGLPAGAQDSADLVFTDPPYTPEGVSTFLVAGLQGLADHDRGRIVLAYGYGEHQPALGVKVQEAVLGLGIAFEAILPGFNRYHGAQAIGSRSDLYVCRPTARTWRALPGLVDTRQIGRIYTHGQRSLESAVDAASPTLITAVQEIVAAGPAPTAAVGSGWTTQPDSVQHVRAGVILERGMPKQVRPGGTVLVELVEEPASWLLRLLLAINAERVVVVTRLEVHDELAGLSSILAGKYTLEPRVVDGRLVLTAQAPATESDDVAVRARRRVLSRAHGKLDNVWREALVAAAGRGGQTLSKNDARELIGQTCDRPDVLTLSLVQLPRHRLIAVLDQVDLSARLSRR